MAWVADIRLVVTFGSHSVARPKPEAVATGQGIFVDLRTVCSLCQVPSVGLRSPSVGLGRTFVPVGWHLGRAFGRTGQHIFSRKLRC